MPAAQVNAFIVRKGARGLRTAKIENKIALRCVQNADIFLDDCFVPEAARLPGVNSFKARQGPAQKCICRIVSINSSVKSSSHSIAWLDLRACRQAEQKATCWCTFVSELHGASFRCNAWLQCRRQ